MRIHCLEDGQVIRVIILWKHVYRFMICRVWVLPGVFPLFLVSCVVQWRFCKNCYYRFNNDVAKVQGRSRAQVEKTNSCAVDSAYCGVPISSLVVLLSFAMILWGVTQHCVTSQRASDKKTTVFFCKSSTIFAHQIIQLIFFNDN